MKILAIGAHLDDIEIACGGTLGKAIENGHDVKVLIMSKSGYTNKEGKVQRSDELAVEEGTKALNTLGITNIEILDFPTKDIPWVSDVVNAIDICISDYDPDIIFTHHPFDTTRPMPASAMRRFRQPEEGIRSSSMNRSLLPEGLMWHSSRSSMSISARPLIRRSLPYANISPNTTNSAAKTGSTVSMPVADSAAMRSARSMPKPSKS